MKREYTISILFVPVLLLIFSNANAQCTGGTYYTSLIMTNSWQVQSCVWGGEYLRFTGKAGNYYTFSFCNGGGSASFDTELTILDDATGNTSYAYNDDNCGLRSEIRWKCPANGTYRIRVTQYSCASNTTCSNLAFKEEPAMNSPCTSLYLYSNKCSCSYTTFSTVGATSSGIANPGCGGYNGGDIWFATKIPYSGMLNISTQAGTITDGAMAVYRGSTCGSLTLISCDDNSGPGNMPAINLTGQTAGDSIYIRFFEKGNDVAGTFGLCVWDPNPSYCMAGTASEINSNVNDNCIQVTPNKQAQASSVWNTTQLDLSLPMDYSIDLYLGSTDLTGADGITFTLHNDPAGTAALGSTGSALGAGGITNSWMVEFDTFDNDGPGGSVDLSSDHIAVSLNGNMGAPLFGPVQASATSVNIEDGNIHTLRFTWAPATQIFNIYFDGALRLSCNYDIINNVLGGSNLAYWGFTGSTGLYTNTHYFCPVNMPGAPLPLTLEKFYGDQLFNNNYLHWVTSSEINVSYFIVERSENSIEFDSIGIVPANGGVNQTFYQFTDQEVSGRTYYRLKMADMDGSFTYSEILSLEKIETSKDFVIYPNPTDQSKITKIILPDSYEEVFLTISDITGLIIFNESVNVSGSEFNIPVHLNKGIYHLTITHGSSTEAKTLYVEK